MAETILLEAQIGFRKERSCMDGVFITKQLIKERTEYNLEMYLLFVDCEKNIQLHIKK
jgi:hypothetical protein